MTIFIYRLITIIADSIFLFISKLKVEYIFLINKMAFTFLNCKIV